MNFLVFALLGGTGVYQLSLKSLNLATGQEYRSEVYLYSLLAHLGLGFALLPVFFVFIGAHLRAALSRPNRVAVRLGLGLLLASLILLVSGVLMVLQRQPLGTKSVNGLILYWTHVIAPVAVIGLYIAHRMAGPSIQWRFAKGWAVAVGMMIAGFGVLHLQEPRNWGQKGAGEDYFFPSSARTSNDESESPFLSAAALMSNEYCMKCHSDAYAGWFHSAHHFASFNNLAYRQTIIDMRKDLDARARELGHERELDPEGDEFKQLRARTLQATRWCAGCHDPVPFFSGAFDDDQFFDDLEVELPLDGQPWTDDSEQLQPTAHTGITCVSCHAITHINSIKGNGDYTIEEPMQYPFTFSENSLLQGINEYLLKASPDLHKRTFMKPFMRTSEFCSVCHKVHLPEPVNNYKWIRGQNHYDSWQNSGASGFGSRSFYHPPTAKNCADCHMPLMESQDFGNIDGKIHNHLFLGANTALPALRSHFGHRNNLPPIGDEQEVIRLHQKFLRDNSVRVDLFALRAGGSVNGKLMPLRPKTPALVPGETYLLEVVVRNLGVGHHFTQGTVDSNEIWLHIQILDTQTKKPIYSSGDIDPFGYVDAEAHFINSLVLDRTGRRIDHRNAKDIFVPLYNHQIPPSSSQVVHYRLQIPDGPPMAVSIQAQVKYRKFDRVYQDFFVNRRRQPQAGALFSLNPLSPLGQIMAAPAWASLYERNRGPELPITILSEDVVSLSGTHQITTDHPSIAQWERFNDYGIALLLSGSEGADRGLLRQAEQAFREVTHLRPEYVDGHINLARVYLQEGRLTQLADALEAAETQQPGYWKTAWLRGILNFQNGFLDEAIQDLKFVLGTKIAERGFDFGKDREVHRLLGEVYFAKAQILSSTEEQTKFTHLAVTQLDEVLRIDPEDRQAHHQLHRCYLKLGDEKLARKHLHFDKLYRIDDNAREYAVRIFRMNHAWADRAAQAVVIYDLKTARR